MRFVDASTVARVICLPSMTASAGASGSLSMKIGSTPPAERERAEISKLASA